MCNSSFSAQHICSGNINLSIISCETFHLILSCVVKLYVVRVEVFWRFNTIRRFEQALRKFLCILVIGDLRFFNKVVVDVIPYVWRAMLNSNPIAHWWSEFWRWELCGRTRFVKTHHWKEVIITAWKFSPKKYVNREFQASFKA